MENINKKLLLSLNKTDQFRPFYLLGGMGTTFYVHNRLEKQELIVGYSYYCDEPGHKIPLNVKIESCEKYSNACYEPSEWMEYKQPDDVNEGTGYILLPITIKKVATTIEEANKMWVQIILRQDQSNHSDNIFIRMNSDKV